MKLPKSIKVGGKQYRIIIEDLLKERGQTCFGYCTPSELEIHISKDIRVEQQKDTLLHEVIEIINSENDLNLIHQTIQTLSTQLYQVLMDNNLLK